MNIEPAASMPPATRKAAAELFSIPVEHLGKVWPLISELVGDVVERSKGRWSVESIVGNLLSGKWQLWVVREGGPISAIVATEIYVEDTGIKLARIVLATGRGAEHWVHLVSEIEEWARDNGAVRLEMMARKGWAKHLAAYRMTHVLLEKDL